MPEVALYWEHTLKDEIDSIQKLLDLASRDTDPSKRSALLMSAERKLEKARGTKRTYEAEAEEAATTSTTEVATRDTKRRRRFENQMAFFNEELLKAIRNLNTLKQKGNGHESEHAWGFSSGSSSSISNEFNNGSTTNMSKRTAMNDNNDDVMQMIFRREQKSQARTPSLDQIANNALMDSSTSDNMGMVPLHHHHHHHHHGMGNTTSSHHTTAPPPPPPGCGTLCVGAFDNLIEFTTDVGSCGGTRDSAPRVTHHEYQQHHNI
eukprot:CAMPEP_0195294008 /NCGR_PEP_ID=MMETSP0707-20130614/13978_1 /TAXON_ID=33640 /ORGANISM="Asterionellopsis glacialis, Strain CCMP134" /LENGTH=263 /DNA_ID=CAMNT_0040354869 /DNA_START=18 /DNA_END=809 /DNA_ORIENTATION=+